MTLTEFIRDLQQLEAKGYGTAPVVVERDTMEAEICEVYATAVKGTPKRDADGFFQYPLTDTTTISLKGRDTDPMP